MALREALDNPKTFRLARIIGCEPWGALGLFEAIRQWMQTYRKNGGVTSEDLLDAGYAIHFSGDLEDVLFRAGYLDVLGDANAGTKHPAATVGERGDESSRGYTSYYFHDWESHCEDSVHMALARSGEYFSNGSKPKMGRLSKEERERAERLYAEQENAQCALSVRTESALPYHTKPIDKETNNAQARAGGFPPAETPEPPSQCALLTGLPPASQGAGLTTTDPWANDEGFSPAVMAADREWGNHMFRKYQHVRDSECILADRRFLAKQPDPGDCVNLAIRKSWKDLKPVFGAPGGKSQEGRGTRDEVRKHPVAEHDYDVRAVQEHGETVMKRFEKGSKTKLFDEAAWYESRGYDPPGGTPIPVRAAHRPSPCKQGEGIGGSHV